MSGLRIATDEIKVASKENCSPFKEIIQVKIIEEVIKMRAMYFKDWNHFLWSILVKKSRMINVVFKTIKRNKAITKEINKLYITVSKSKSKIW